MKKTERLKMKRKAKEQAEKDNPPVYSVAPIAFLFAVFSILSILGSIITLSDTSAPFGQDPEDVGLMGIVLWSIVLATALSSRNNSIKKWREKKEKQIYEDMLIEQDEDEDE